MSIAAILQFIDDELQKLQQARIILAQRLTPAPAQKNIRREPFVPEPLAEISAATAPPRLTIVPPKKMRESRRMHKPHVQEPRALSSSVPGGPVFVPKSAVPLRTEPVNRATSFDAESLEFALRQNLRGGVA